MRLDHIAYRCFDKNKTAKFFMDAFGYKPQAEFEIFFNDEKTEKALCIALEPPEKVNPGVPFHFIHNFGDVKVEYFLAPEIFISEGTPNSIVHNWCLANGNKAGIHHLAYEVDDVEAQRKLWIEKGWGDFTFDHAFKCDDLTQIFTTAHALTGVVFEFIERKSRGFCSENVKQLMLASTVKLDGNIK